MANEKLSTRFLFSTLFATTLVLINLEMIIMVNPYGENPNVFFIVIFVFMALIGIRVMMQIQMLKTIANKQLENQEKTKRDSIIDSLYSDNDEQSS